MLGQKEEAIAEGKRAVELLPNLKTPWMGRRNRGARPDLCLDRGIR